MNGIVRRGVRLPSALPPAQERATLGDREVGGGGCTRGVGRLNQLPPLHRGPLARADEARDRLVDPRRKVLCGGTPRAVAPGRSTGGGKASRRVGSLDRGSAVCGDGMVGGDELLRREEVGGLACLSETTPRRARARACCRGSCCCEQRAGWYSWCTLEGEAAPPPLEPPPTNGLCNYRLCVGHASVHSDRGSRAWGSGGCARCVEQQQHRPRLRPLRLRPSCLWVRRLCARVVLNSSTCSPTKVTILVATSGARCSCRPPPPPTAPTFTATFSPLGGARSSETRPVKNNTLVSSGVCTMGRMDS